jgi:hypothetical protein
MILANQYDSLIEVRNRTVITRDLEGQVGDRTEENEEILLGTVSVLGGRKRGKQTGVENRRRVDGQD